MIVFDDVSVHYTERDQPTLSRVNLTVAEAELCLVVGRTGTGKSTLLKTINGLVPHFTGGTLRGRVTVDGRDTATHAPRDLADIVGMVSQDPADGFVTDVVEEELAYGMESLGLSAPVMRRRVEETLDVLGLADLRDRALTSLSGGQRQRVAIGAVLTSHPSILVLDEPTSALDPPAAEDVLAVIQRLVHDLGLTVVIAEHRLERVVHLADRVVHLGDPGTAITAGTPTHVMATATVAPPVVELGRLAGWDPLPLSIRDARRRATGLVSQLSAFAVKPATNDALSHSAGDQAAPVATIDHVWKNFGTNVVLRDVSVSVHRGEVVALMGRNGAGKSTLLHTMVGLIDADSGQVTVDGRHPSTLSARDLVRTVTLVPQDPGDLLYADTIAEEAAAADRDLGVDPGSCAATIAQFLPTIDLTWHPRDLSEGQRLLLALAIVLTASPPLVLLDEPTRGLDYHAKRHLGRLLRRTAAQGRTVVIATHDVEFAAATCDRTMILADGELVVDGPTSEIAVASPSFAPQVAKVMSPLALLTVEDVAHNLAGSPA